MGPNVVFGAVILWIVPIFVAHAQGKSKHRSGAAFGIFLGWLGVIILALLPQLAPPTPEDELADLDRNRGQYKASYIEQRRAEILTKLEERATAVRCPFCKESVHPEATVCAHCQRDMTPELVGSVDNGPARA